MNMVKDLFYAQQTLFSLFSVTNKLQIQGDKHLQEMTIRQILAIPALFHAPDGKATINHIARSMGTTKQNAKQIVDAMQRKGYVAVAPSERDKRAVNITITPKGEQIFKVCSERIDEFLADLFGDFSTEEMEILYKLLHKLYQFDNAGREDVDYRHSHAGDEDTVLNYHSQYVKRRVENNRKKPK